MNCTLLDPENKNLNSELDSEDLFPNSNSGGNAIKEVTI